MFIASRSDVPSSIYMPCKDGHVVNVVGEVQLRVKVGRL